MLNTGYDFVLVQFSRRESPRKEKRARAIKMATQVNARTYLAARQESSESSRYNDDRLILPRRALVQPRTSQMCLRRHRWWRGRNDGKRTVCDVSRCTVIARVRTEVVRVHTTAEPPPRGARTNQRANRINCRRTSIKCARYARALFYTIPYLQNESVSSIRAFASARSQIYTRVSQQYDKLVTLSRI